MRRSVIFIPGLSSKFQMNKYSCLVMCPLGWLRNLSARTPEWVSWFLSQSPRKPFLFRASPAEKRMLISTWLLSQKTYVSIFTWVQSIEHKAHKIHASETYISRNLYLWRHLRSFPNPRSFPDDPLGVTDPSFFMSRPSPSPDYSFFIIYLEPFHVSPPPLLSPWSSVSDNCLPTSSLARSLSLPSDR